jgi:hypothetical protein
MVVVSQVASLVGVKYNSTAVRVGPDTVSQLVLRRSMVRYVGLWQRLTKSIRYGARSICTSAAASSSGPCPTSTRACRRVPGMVRRTEAPTGRPAARTCRCVLLSARHGRKRVTGVALALVSRYSTVREADLRGLGGPPRMSHRDRAPNSPLYAGVCRTGGVSDQLLGRSRASVVPFQAEGVLARDTLREGPS